MNYIKLIEFIKIEETVVVKKRKKIKDTSFRKKKKFNKKIAKKILSEKEKRKREWRKKIKGKHKRHYNKKLWTFLQKTANRKERRRIKQCDFMDWDNYSHKRKREFFDPWDYD